MSIKLAFLAGLFSILAPCVLPLVPIVLGAAISEHRLGPVALAGGLTLSFLTFGLLISTVGFALEIDDAAISSAGAILLMVFGIVLLVPNIQARVALAAGPVANWAEQRLGGSSPGGLSGQFLIGLLLGITRITA